MAQSLDALPTMRWTLQRDFMARLPVAEEEAIQTGPGVMAYDAVCAFGQDVVVAYMSVAARGIINLRIDPDWLSVLVPLRWSGSFIYNGGEAARGSIFVAIGRDGYTTRSEGRHNLAVAFRKTALRRAIARLSGVHEEDVRLRKLVASLPPNVRQTIVDATVRALFNAAETRIEGNRRGIHPVEEGRVCECWARLLAAFFLKRQAPETSRRSPLNIVRSAEAAWETIDRPPSVAELCAASGVSERHLRSSFHQVFGVSPNRYLKLKRLSGVRQRLLDPEARPGSVKEVALDFGFLESGRLAAEYWSVYGETPGDTLAMAARSR